VVALEAMVMGETLHGEIMVVVQGDFASVASGPIAAVVDAPRDLAGKKVVIIRDMTLTMTRYTVICTPPLSLPPTRLLFRKMKTTYHFLELT